VSTKATIYDISLVERRMTLTYWVGYELRTFAGWARLSHDRQGVVARKIGGRNRWSLCSLADVDSVDFG